MAKFGGFSIGGAISGAVSSKLTSAINVDSIMSGNMDPNSLSVEGLLGQTEIGSKILSVKDSAVNSQLGKTISGAKERLENSKVYGKVQEFVSKAENSTPVVKAKELGSNAVSGIAKKTLGIDLDAVKAGDISSVQNLDLDNMPSASDIMSSVPDPKSFDPSKIMNFGKET